MCPPYPPIGWPHGNDIYAFMMCNHEDEFMLIGHNMIVCSTCLDYRNVPLNWVFV